MFEVMLALNIQTFCTVEMMMYFSTIQKLYNFYFSPTAPTVKYFW